ncbi:MAG: heat-shock protein Hsp20 [Planctomyces sp.]|jgi:HSP20 family protein|nr:heat-shock protein Hsp20 [Planctomyces sp.]
MAIFRWGNAWQAVGDFEQEVDHLLASVLQGLRVVRQYPAVNLYDLPDQLLLTAELPGIRLEELDISVSEGSLTLKGRHIGPENVPDEVFRRQERPRGKWQRILKLPEGIREDEVSAQFANGVLLIRLPKHPPKPVRQIAVTAVADGVSARDGHQEMIATPARRIVSEQGSAAMTQPPLAQGGSHAD